MESNTDLQPFNFETIKPLQLFTIIGKHDELVKKIANKINYKNDHVVYVFTSNELYELNLENNGKLYVLINNPLSSNSKDELFSNSKEDDEDDDEFYGELLDKPDSFNFVKKFYDINFDNFNFEILRFENKDTRQIFIFDNVDIKNNKSFNMYMQNHRHFGTSIIYTHDKFSSLPAIITGNVDVGIYCKLIDRKDRKELKSMEHYAFRNELSFDVVKFLMSFDRLIVIDHRSNLSIENRLFSLQV